MDRILGYEPNDGDSTSSGATNMGLSYNGYYFALALRKSEFDSQQLHHYGTRQYFRVWRVVPQAFHHGPLAQLVRVRAS